MSAVTITTRRWFGALALLAALAFGRPAHAQTTEGIGAPKPAASETVEAAKLSKLPKQTKFVEAEYPEAAAKKGIEAQVGLLLDIDATGHVTGVVVTEPAATPGLGFEDAATLAAQQFEFEPAELDGKPIAVQLNYRTKFKLKTAAAAPVAGPPGSAPPPVPAHVPVANYTGTLRERGTRLAMAGVVVTIFRDVDGKPEGFEATTDGEGRFRFFDLAPAEWKLLVEAPGFYPFRTSEVIKPNEAIAATYYVERGSYNPYDVTVTATRPRKEVSRTVIDAKLADKIPGTSGDPLAVVQNFAGVARTPLSGLLIVRGSAPEDTRVFADGAEIPLAYHFGGLRSVLPVGMLDSIEFYPGNFSPMYGRATGGVVDIQIKKLAPPKIGGYLDVSLLDSGFYVEAPIGKKGGLALAGRRSYIDYLIKAATPDDASVNIVQAPRYYDYQLLGSYRLAAGHELRGFFFASDDQLRLLFQNPAEVDTSVGIAEIKSKTTFYRSQLSYRYVPNDRLSNDLRLAQGRNKFLLSAGPLLVDVNFYTAQLRDNLRYKLLDALALTVGFDGVYAKTDALVQLPLPPKEGDPNQMNVDLSRLLRSENRGTVHLYPAVFTELELRPLPGLLVLPGVRLDRFARAHEYVAQPRITARWSFGEQLVLKGGAGLFAQEANIQEGEDDPIFGNPDLKTEHALHYSAGVEYRPVPHISFDLTGFYKDLSHLISRTNSVKLVDGMEKPLIYDNNGKGRVVGLELVARHEFTRKFTGWLAYTFSRSQRMDSGSTNYRLFDFDQTHILTTVASYLLPRNWQIGGRFRLVSGNPITPVVGAVYNSSRDQYDAVYGAVNSARNPIFNQLDVRIDKRWIFPRWMFSVYLDMQNVYNRSNTEAPDYNYNFRESRSQQGFPILTILGLRAEL
jgi:TonB family protein